MSVAGTMDTVVKPSTTDSGEGMCSSTCAINELTLDTENLDEMEKQEVLCKLMMESM